MRKKGFTLLEVLLAIGLSALVLTSAYSALRLGWLSYSKLDNQSQVFQDLRNGLDKLSRDLRNPLFFNASQKEREIGFIGNKDEMSFVTLIKSRNKEGISYVEAARVFYKFEDKNLLKACLKGIEFLKPEPKPEYEVFLTNLTELEFSYAKSNDLKWEESFSSSDKDKFPYAVRMKLTQKFKDLPAITLTKTVKLTSEK